MQVKNEQTIFLYKTIGLYKFKNNKVNIVQIYKVNNEVVSVKGLSKSVNDVYEPICLLRFGNLLAQHYESAYYLYGDHL